MTHTFYARMPRQSGGILFASVIFAFAAGCAGPSYPNCSTDDTCRPKGEYCVDNKCAQCRTSANCPGDVCATCEHGTCGRKAGCCASKLDCGGGQKCEANACVPECKSDRDCASGQKCSANGACQFTSVAGGKAEGCSSDDDCGGDLRCQNGLCVDAKGQCHVVPVRFDFNEYTLSSSAQGLLVADYKCMKQNKQRTLTVEGHCDERGTDAYNLELGGRRAAAVKKYLLTLDPKFKLKTLSYGKAKPVCGDESDKCYAQNRRAEMSKLH